MTLNLAQRSSKVINFGTNRKRVYIFLLATIATWTLSCTVSEIRQINCRKSTIFPTLLLFRLKFGGVPFGVYPLCWGLRRVKWLGESSVKLFSQKSNLYDHDTSTSQTDRQTYRQTDNLNINKHNKQNKHAYASLKQLG